MTLSTGTVAVGQVGQITCDPGMNFGFMNNQTNITCSANGWVLTGIPNCYYGKVFSICKRKAFKMIVNVILEPAKSQLSGLSFG